MSNFGTVTLRRLLLVAISLGFGVVVTVLTVWFVLSTTMDDYGPIYTLFTILSSAAGLAIWLDHEKVLNTQILPH